MLSRNISHLSKDTIAGIDAQEQRRGGRFGLTDVVSDRGRVLDLSHCGAMVVKKRFRRAPASTSFPITIKHHDIRLTLTARLVRKDQVKGVGVVLGLEFVDVTPQQREKIKEIILCCRHWNVISEEGEAA